MRKVKEVLEDTHESGQIEHFHEMSEGKVKHFLNPHSQCKVYKAEKLELVKRSGKHGLLVTCEKEDLDTGKYDIHIFHLLILQTSNSFTVEMRLDDLLNEIVCKSFHVPGYFLYECLQKSAKHFKIERDTNCSIFFQPTKQVGPRHFYQHCQSFIS